MDAQDRVTGADDPRAKQRSGDREEGSVRGNELVATGEPDDLVDSLAGLAVAGDLVEKRVDAGLRPKTRKLRMGKGLCGQVDPRMGIQLTCRCHKRNLLCGCAIVADPGRDAAHINGVVERVESMKDVRVDGKVKVVDRARTDASEKAGQFRVERLSRQNRLEDAVIMGNLAQEGQVGIIAHREDVGARMLLGILPLVSIVRGKFMG